MDSGEHAAARFVFGAPHVHRDAGRFHFERNTGNVEHELFELTGALGEVGRGVFMLTKGMTTTIPWLERVAERNRRPVNIAALFVDPNEPERVFGEFAEIDAARSRGRELWGHVSCFPLGMEFTLRHPYPLEALIAWKPPYRNGRKRK